MFDSEIEEWQEKVDTLPRLKSERSSYIHQVKSGFIDGIEIDDVATYDTRVQFQRAANDEVGYKSIIEYEIAVEFGGNNPRLTFSPEAAIAMGRTLMLAGTAALRDKAYNLGFLAGSEVWI